ncbi:MAG TPA: hypothetical protein VFY90_10050 [Tepidiformaceae bacterium]|nr:hypothetical protein [Tepidiformaceae bacterium]
MTRFVLAGTLAVALLGTAVLHAPKTASAHGDPTCAGALGSDIVVHGQHIVGDYVTGLGGIFDDGLEWPPAGQVGQTIGGNGGAVIPGGPGPGFHFTIDGLAPGASFCTGAHTQVPFNTPDNVPVPGNRD